MATVLKNVLHSVLTDTFSEIYTLAEKTSYINTQNCYGETALIYAAANGDKELVENLLKSGSRIDHQDNEGRTALHWATIRGHLEIAKLLSEHSNINLQDDLHKTPLLLAIEYDQYDTAAYLLTLSTIKINHRDHAGNTALHWAVHANSQKLTELLLNHKVQIDTPNNFGSTPLMWAAKNGNMALVNLLLDHGADPELYDNLDRNALLRAIENNHRPAAETLLNRFNVSKNSKILHHATHIAEVRGHIDLARLLKEKVTA